MTSVLERDSALVSWEIVLFGSNIQLHFFFLGYFLGDQPVWRVDTANGCNKCILVQPKKKKNQKNCFRLAFSGEFWVTEWGNEWVECSSLKIKHFVLTWGNLATISTLGKTKLYKICGMWVRKSQVEESSSFLGIS